jgi:putative spermidine/putrescine transport system permease protein
MTPSPGPRDRRATVPCEDARWLHAHPRTRLGLILALPVAWLVVAYLGSLLILFVNAFWSVDPFTSLVIREFTLDNFVELLTTDVYRAVTLRTVTMAALVTATCILLAYPIAYYMARVASPRVRAGLAVAIVMPLWASYGQAYSRLMLSENGVLDWRSTRSGCTARGTATRRLARLRLPLAAVHDHADLRRLERIPPSLLEASADLGGGWLTFRRIICRCRSRRSRPGRSPFS